ncbi:ubiquinone biosynthesis methyltransferase [Plasmodium gonderi]|uniref:2-methoxy-6-polyprenyl-1,4-benzoquinol methylase, mitochondrial n=1 Tax=Plasmodium gonderi TaxID=77519 RepID=A0A1Y1JFN5_PLAGO|nr:ubiquinone biosynthesis methyltransferase [Plasmodium gonderi]GAW79562.1 ubiquinone biosynthesis methyltransferase [Plasmodium gonderi]
MKGRKFCSYLHSSSFRMEKFGTFLRIELKSLSTQSGSFGSDKRIYNFGFKKVTEEIKSKLVYNLFSHVCNKYDLMNDLMSLRLHRCWKNQLVKELDLFLKYHSYKAQEQFYKNEENTLHANEKRETKTNSSNIFSYSKGEIENSHENKTEHCSHDYESVRQNEATKEEGKNFANFSTSRILDLAGGTGDIAFRILEKYEYYLGKTNYRADFINTSKPPFVDTCRTHFDSGEQYMSDEFYQKFFPEIIICDVNKDMIEVGKKRAKERNYEKNITWIIENAENLKSIEDNSIDIVTLSFGIRNFTNIPKALNEIYRILKPGGRFLCLEFCRVNCTLLKPFYNIYLMNIIPLLGKIITNSEDSYKYLAESIQTFLTPDELSQLIHQSSFRNISYSTMTMGIVAIHSAYKIG